MAGLMNAGRNSKQSLSGSDLCIDTLGGHPGLLSPPSSLPSPPTLSPSPDPSVHAPISVFVVQLSLHDARGSINEMGTKMRDGLLVDPSR